MSARPATARRAAIMRARRRATVAALAVAFAIIAAPPAAEALARALFGH